MKKMKALFLTLALVFTGALTATATGCDKIFNKGDSTSTDSSINDDGGFENSEVSFASVTFEKADVSVYQYEEVALVCAAKGTTDAIVYTSEDESVATVDANGKVTAKDKIGSVKITATAGGASATCTVKVEKSPYHPEIILDSTNYTVEEGEALEFNVTTEWNKIALSEAVEYSVSFAENSQNANATISVSGSTIKVVAATAESFDIVVSAMARGLYTSEQVTVNVIAPKLKILPMDAAFMPANGKYETKISSTDLVGDMVNSIPLSFAVKKGGENLDGVAIDWSIDGKAVAVENGNLVGKEVGKATLTGTAEYAGETTTVTLVCDVIPPELTLDETIILDLQTTNLTFKFASTFIGSLKSAEFDGVVVSTRAKGQTIAFDAKKFPKEGSKLGKQELILNTTLVRYTMPIEVYTMIINDADELDQMRLVANTGEEEYSIRFSNEQGVDVYRNAQFYDGYFVLGNDINYNKTIMSMTDSGSVWQVQGRANDDRGFKGIFDGCGYNIDGVTVGNNPSGAAKEAGGVFGYIATGGIVKNVSFTNAVLLENGGFICSRGNGTVENVSISYKKIGGDKEGTSANAMGSFFSVEAGTKATVKNCLVDASAAEIAVEYSGNNKDVININLVGKASNVQNAIALCPDTRVLETSGADIERLTYNDLIAESELMEPFDKTYWTTVDGIPMFVKQAESLNRDLPVDFLNVKTSLVAGFSMLVLANNPYTTIEVEPVEGVTFENSMLSATEEAYTKKVTLKVTSLFNAENSKTMEVYIDSFGTKVAAPTTETAVVYYNNPVLTIGDNSWMGDKNYVYIGADIYSVGEGEGSITIDWKKFGWEKQAVTIVTVKGDVRTHFDANVQIGYPSNNFADSVKVEDSVLVAKTFEKHVLFDVDMQEEGDETKAPEGYEMISRVDSNTTWVSALPREFFNATDLTAYQDIWFSMKIVNGFWVMRATQQFSITGWVSFHYVQIEEGVWAVEVSVDGQHFITEYNVEGINLKYMTYRSGWGNGLLLYNNQGSCPEGETTRLYVTEVRGVLK